MAATLVNPRLGLAESKPNSKFGGVQIGVISYSYREMPDFTATGVLRYAVEDGINAVELENVQEEWAGAPVNPIIPALKQMMARNGPPPPAGQGGQDAFRRLMSSPEMKASLAKYTEELTTWRLSVPMSKYAELRKMYRDKGVTIYAFKAAITMDMQPAECDYIFNAAKACGANQVTMEMPDGKPELTKKIGDYAAKHKVWVGYHAHLQAKPDTWDQAMSQSPYNGINLDIGHYTAAGNHDALAFIEKNHARITSMHMKDRQFPEHGGKNLPWGQGDTPIVQALQLAKKNGYTFPCTIELEYPIPPGSDAVKEVGNCLTYAKSALS